MRAWIALVLAALVAMPVSVPAATAGAVPDCCTTIGSHCHDATAPARLECCSPATPQPASSTSVLVRSAGDPRPLTAVVVMPGTPGVADSCAAASLVRDRSRLTPGVTPVSTVLRI